MITWPLVQRDFIDVDFSPWILKDEQKFPGEWLGWEELEEES